MEMGNVVLDPMAGLLLTVSQDSSPFMPNRLLRRILHSNTWQNHQRGLFDLKEAARQLAHLPFLSTTPWSAADEILRVLQNRAVIAAPFMLQLLDILQKQLHLRLFCVCNASAGEFHHLQRQFPALFAKFDASFTSGQEGVGKPSVRFLKMVMEKASISAHHTLYLDSHDLASIIAARSLGMHAFLVKPALMNEQHQSTSPVHLYGALIRDILLVFNPTLTHLPPLLQYRLPSTMDSLSPNINITLPSSRKPATIEACKPASTARLQGATPGHRSTAIDSARKFLLQNGGHDPKKLIQHASTTSNGIQISDNFVQFLMADLLDDTCFLPMQSLPASGLLCFINRNSNLNDNKDIMWFSDSKPDYNWDACTFPDIPDDIDTTSIGLSVLHKFGMVGLETIHKVLDKMLKYVSKDDGILQVYFELERPRIEPVAIVNALFLFHLANRGHEVEKSERFVQSILLHRAYVKDGTLYYPLGESFLWSVARLVHTFEEHFTRSGMRSILAARLQEQRSLEERGNALALVMRMCACALCGQVEEDLHTKEEEESKVFCLQQENGSWKGHAYTRHGGNAQSWIGNEGLTTAFAMCALQAKI